MNLSLAFFIDSVNFTRGVIAGDVSLGGSESACVGLARALKARGHEVHIFATKLDEDAQGDDQAGVAWHPVDHLAVLNQYIEWDVFTALRMFMIFGSHRINARLRMLWNQDLLIGEQPKNACMSTAWQMDHVAYVSEFHRRQWEELVPELQSFGWVTRNGFDPTLVPRDVTKKPNQIIHISRPERAIAPILAMWPELRKQRPDAELMLCRYSSMYDAGGWGRICEDFDRQVAAVNERVGGITYLGELGKPALYRAIAESAVMWYPGIVDFAETGCIAAVEAMACGSPFVGSYKGALPETAKPSMDRGFLIRGDALQDPAYHAASIGAVLELLEGCRHSTRNYREFQEAGREHAWRYRFDQIAGEWEHQIASWFRERYESNRLGVLRRLLHEDDHVAAALVADQILQRAANSSTVGATEMAATTEACDARALCERVIAGQESTAEDYAKYAVADPAQEATCSRFKAVSPMFAACHQVLDVACGNGAFALRVAQDHPDMHVLGVDYSEGNVTKAREAAETLGLADRCEFQQLCVYDADRQQLGDAWQFFARAHAGAFDGMFVGEFVEHVAGYQAVIDGLEAVLTPGATVVYTCPNGPWVELGERDVPRKRGHVHRFAHDDLYAVFGPKTEWNIGYLALGYSVRGKPIGSWIVRYRVAPNHPAGIRPLEGRAQRTRPHQRLSVGLITKNAERDLARCLDSVWRIADEIVVGDTGSTDKTTVIAAEYHARVLRLPSVETCREGFSAVRNAVLDACVGEWFLWIDADEQLVGADELHKYLEAGPFNGLTSHQNHLMLDAPPSYDNPVRVFRRDGVTRFFGCVHEQPGAGDPNVDIMPALEAHDVQIAHLGYLTDEIRRDKMLRRNLPLLQRDQQVFPHRRLGLVLVLRDYVNLAAYDREAARGAMTVRAEQFYQRAIALFDAELADPTDKLYHLARPWYEQAVQALGGFEIEVALGGRLGGLEQRKAKPERLWVRSAAELDRVLEFKMASIRKAMAPAPCHVDPFDDAGRCVSPLDPLLEAQLAP
jgi:glycosyltransferase involved in cell wall biosynthesis/2-polyprenyl-3-methyl-5-hydroxy-6-metoxy-1,4-benzoquinol methylase